MNIVRKEEAVEVLKAIGAVFVANSFLPSFKEDVLAAVKANRGPSRVRCNGRWDSRDGYSDIFRHVSASPVPRSGSPRED